MKYFYCLASLLSTVFFIIYSGWFYGQKEETPNNSPPRQDENSHNKNDNSMKSYWVFVQVLAPLLCFWLANRSSTRIWTNAYLRKTLPVLEILIWLFLACIAPFWYLPETSLIWPQNVLPVGDPEGTPVSKNRGKVLKYKDKYAETSGSQNKRIKAECFQYAKTRERIQRKKRELITRIKHLVQAFKAKCYRGETSLLKRSELIKQYVKKVQRLKRELIVLEHCLGSMRAQLEFQRSQNKQMIENYEKIHQQMSYLVRSAVQTC